MTSLASNRLPVLAHEINEHNIAHHACEVKSVMHALRMGQLLAEAKKLVPHGSFLDWVKSNTKVTPRMCQIYMRLAKNDEVCDSYQRKYETVSHLTIQQAVKLDRTDKQDAKAIGRAFKKSRECQREAADALVEIRKRFSDDASFTDWIVSMGTPRSMAEKFAALIADEYDADAWMDATLTALEEEPEWFARQMTE